MSYNNHRFQSTLHGLGGLLSYSLPLAFIELSGCTSVIQSLAQPEGQSLSNAPQHVLIPRREAKVYESPIPHNGDRLVAASKVDVRGYERITSVVAAVFEVGAAFTPPGAVPRTASALQAARWVCGHRLTLNLEDIVFRIDGLATSVMKSRWDRVSLQPGSLAERISEARCVEKYRRIR
ncbi:MAG TPA: hypothetical protein VGJ64_04325 [Gemmatimonadaceae bacterium]